MPSTSAIIRVKRLRHIVEQHARILEDSADLYRALAAVYTNELLRGSDNDFGVDGAETAFWSVKFDPSYVAAIEH